MSALVIRGDARTLPLPDASVDLVVTSPPYFALRSYQDAGEHYAGQIGSEATPGEFVAALIECTREWMRVLKPSGSLWVNLGDKYAGASSGPRSGMADGYERAYESSEFQIRRRRLVDLPQKSLIGLPWRYALACIDQLGLILRAEVIWSKPNGLPESVTDRVRRSHEQWFHFTVQPRYYSAVDEVREPHTHKANGAVFGGKKAVGADSLFGAAARRQGNNTYDALNPLGKLPGSVWEIPSEPLKVPDHLGIDHFAAFPTEWPRRIIAGWSPPGICVECGEGRRPVVDKALDVDHIQNNRRGFIDLAEPYGNQRGMNAAVRVNGSTRATITGYVCACPEPTAPTRRAVVLDPFGGTGTTALVASALGRTGITVDRSADYCRLAGWRTSDPGQRARVLGMPPPQKQLEGQTALFDDEGAA